MQVIASYAWPRLSLEADWLAPHTTSGPVTTDNVQRNGDTEVTERALMDAVATLQRIASGDADSRIRLAASRLHRVSLSSLERAK